MYSSKDYSSYRQHLNPLNLVPKQYLWDLQDINYAFDPSQIFLLSSFTITQ